MAKKEDSNKKLSKDIKKLSEEELRDEKRTRLAEIRTELAHERTMMSDLRTSSTVILFGIAFIGFSKVNWDFFFNAGIIAIALGIIFFLSAVQRGWKHSREIKNIQNLFSRIKGGYTGIKSAPLRFLKEYESSTEEIDYE